MLIETYILATANAVAGPKFTACLRDKTRGQIDGVSLEIFWPTDLTWTPTKREIGSTEKVTPEALPISGPTEAPAEESVKGADRPVSSEELPRHGQAAAISAEPVHSDEAKNGARDKVERRAAKIGQVANQALSGGTGIDVTAAHVDTTHIRRTVEVAPRKERSRSKEA